MKLMIAPLVLLVVACGSQPPAQPNFFVQQDQFAADRERQTTVVDLESTEEACLQVVAVLLDLDCGLVETDHRLGLVSARSGPHLLPPAGLPDPGPNPRSCAGRQVTVSVSPQGRNQLAVRAAFKPRDTRAEETFRTLLLRSLAFSRKQEPPHE